MPTSRSGENRNGIVRSALRASGARNEAAAALMFLIWGDPPSLGTTSGRQRVSSISLCGFDLESPGAKWPVKCRWTTRNNFRKGYEHNETMIIRTPSTVRRGYPRQRRFSRSVTWCGRQAIRGDVHFRAHRGCRRSGGSAHRDRDRRGKPLSSSGSLRRPAREGTQWARHAVQSAWRHSVAVQSRGSSVFGGTAGRGGRTNTPATASGRRPTANTTAPTMPGISHMFRKSGKPQPASQSSDRCAGTVMPCEAVRSGQSPPNGNTTCLRRRQ